ncbi:MAG: galactosyldiacylglycerol synthase, partial [Elusimicrobia bacterium]|nr:galactosyldiacylglycerol synthase [Elusimicrobiota bacterium]
MDGLKTRLIGVCTDFLPHPYWAVPGADLYVTANAAGAKMMAKRGIPRKLLLDAGIPLHPVFDAPPDKTAARRALRIGRGERLILLSGGGRGLGRLAEACEELLSGLPQARLAVVCGDNEALAGSLRRTLPARRADVRGRVEACEMRRLMEAADLMVGKPGGLTSAESLALGLPLVVFDPIAGQELANAEFLSRAGAAVVVGQPEELPALAASLLRPRRLLTLRRAARRLGRPDAGARVLEAILA